MKCKWTGVAEGLECSGKMKEADLFPGADQKTEAMIEAASGCPPHKVLICEAHLRVHTEIFAAHELGVPFDKNIKMSAAKRHNKIRDE